MAPGQTGTLLRHIRQFAATQAAKDLSDTQLLQRFVAHQEQTAFAALFQRYSPLVWKVCRRVLGREQDAEDAFQATFLVLAQRAASIRKGESVGSWLFGVAHRVAMKARQAAHRRQRNEAKSHGRAPEQPVSEAALRELQARVNEEVARLPAKYRAVFVLCGLEGKSREEAARELGLNTGTLSARLARARSRLRAELARRGVCLSAALSVLALGAGTVAALPAGLATSTLKALRLRLAGRAAGAVSSQAEALARGVLHGMAMTKLKTAALALLALVAFAAAGAGARPGGAGGPHGEVPAPKAKASAGANGGSAALKGTGSATDMYGDPLPPAALARLGTVRLRQGGQVSALSLSADGKLIASGGVDNVARLWDAATGRQVGRIAGLVNASGVALSPDGKTVAAASNGRVYLFDAATGKERRALQAGNFFQAFGVAFSPDGKWLACGAVDGIVYLWEVATGKLHKQLRVPRGPQVSLPVIAFSPDGKQLASGGGDKMVRLWDVATGTEVRSFAGHTDRVTSVAVAPGGKVLASAGADQTVRLWEAATGKALRRVPMPRGATSVAFSPDGTRLAAGDWYGTIRLLSVATGKTVRRLTGHTSGIGALRFTADGKSLVSGSWDKTIRVWDPATGRERRQWAGHQGAVIAAAYSPDGKILASAGDDHAVRLWDPATRREIRRLALPPREVIYAVAFAPDGKHVAAAGNGVGVWDVRTGAVVRRWKAGKVVYCLAFAGDGKTLAWGGEDRTIHLADPATGEERTMPGHRLPVRGVAFSPDGRTLASAGGEYNRPGRIRLWDVAGGKELPALRDRKVAVCCLAFSPDGKTLAAAGEDYRIRFWDVTTGANFLVLQADKHFSGLFRFPIAFSPDGRALGSGTQTMVSADPNRPFALGNTVRVWELATGKERIAFRGHRGPIRALSFAPDGRSLASGSEDTSLLIWDLTGQRAEGPRAGTRTAREQAALAADLSSSDAAKAYRALCLLARSPGRALSLVKQFLRPVRAADANRVARLLDDLNSDRFATRRRAMRELTALGSSAEPALRRALRAQPASVEVVRRIERLLKKLEDLSSGRLRAIRALELLEQVDTPEARQFLEALARGAEGAWLTREAKASLRRLAKRGGAAPRK
jgi:RNA polymerase sigma factor (sigma-70 family)